MALLSKAAILGKQDVASQDVEVQEWGGSLRVRSMTVAERNEFARRTKEGGAEHVSAWLVSLLSIDESGNRLFTEADIPELEKRSFQALDRVVAGILKVNGMSDEKIKEAEKN